VRVALRDPPERRLVRTTPLTRESRPPPDGWVNPLSRRFIPQTQVRVGRIATTWGAILVTYLAVAAEPLPGPSEDRVGFPTGYATNYVVLRTVERDEGAKLVTVYGNAVAASVTNKAQLPYPNDSVLVMETAGTVRRADGKPDRAASGLPKKDAVLGAARDAARPEFWRGPMARIAAVTGSSLSTVRTDRTSPRPRNRAPVPSAM
jgi:hypothetical protein